MNYTQEQFNNAQPITGSEYMNLDNLNFEGQTRADSQGNYKMYWSDNIGKLYVTSNSLEL